MEERNKKPTLVSVSQKFTMPDEVKRKKAYAKKPNVEATQQPLSPITREEIEAFENLVTSLPNMEVEAVVNQDQLLSYEEEVKDTESLPPLVEEVEYPQIVLYCPIHEIPVHHNVSKNGWAYVKCGTDNCPVWLAEEKAEPILTGLQLTMHPDLKEEVLLCFCEEPARLGMSQKKWSRGRCFLTCRQNPACEYFRWVDEPMQIQVEFTQANKPKVVARVMPSPRHAPYQNPCETDIQKQPASAQRPQNQPRNNRKQSVPKRKHAQQ